MGAEGGMGGEGQRGENRENCDRITIKNDLIKNERAVAGRFRCDL